MAKLNYSSLLLLLLLIPFVSSESQVQTLGIFLKETDVTLYQTCGDCSYNNVSYVTYPNGTTIISNVEMTQSGVTYSYVLIKNYTKDLGEYTVCGFGDPSSTVTTWCYNFFINETGRADPPSAVLVLFIVVFIGLLTIFVWLFVYALGHAIKQDFDLMDLGFCFGIYFAILGIYYLQQTYLGMPLMNNILNILVYVGAFTHVLFASIFFFISMFRANTDKVMKQTGGSI